MTVAAGTAVANLYYNQPLLADIARTFGVSVAQVGWVPTLTQVGYAVGMFFIVPLGDLFERRRLTVVMAAASIAALLLAATSRSFGAMAAASLAIGAASIVPQLLVPFAAHLSPPATRGRNVGMVMSGLLVGILLARTVSGLVGQHLGWRAMFWIASVVMAILAAALSFLLPYSRPQSTLSYGALMKSLWQLARDEPILREASLTGALLFGGFSVFWATMVFLIEGAPYHYGSQAAGMFGLLGVAGAMTAPLAGRLSDRRSPRITLRAAVAITLASFGVFVAGRHLWALVVGVILLDAGVQGGHVSNQSRIYALAAESHNRVNTVYMVSYFIGGSVGSSLGAYAWQRFGWNGVCGAGALLLAIGAAVLVRREPASA